MLATAMLLLLNLAAPTPPPIPLPPPAGSIPEHNTQAVLDAPQRQQELVRQALESALNSAWLPIRFHDKGVTQASPAAKRNTMPLKMGKSSTLHKTVKNNSLVWTNAPDGAWKPSRKKR